MDEEQKVITIQDIIGEKSQIQASEQVKEQDSPQSFTPVGMHEVHVNEDTSTSTDYIENPLPVPKRKEHKQMDYAINLTKDNDFYDITDMTGMDFFDLD